MKRRALLLGGAALAAGPLLAAQAVPAIAAEVRRRLVDAAVVRGEFEQRKTLAGFRHPLVSRGNFFVARDRGVVWATRTPVASTLVVTRDRLLVRDAAGSVTTRMDAAAEPSLRAVNAMLFALVGGDLQVLAQRFDVQGELPDAERWRLALAPREAGLRQWITRIEMEGDRFVRSAHLVEARGDSTVIRFGQSAAAAALTSDEERQFD